MNGKISYGMITPLEKLARIVEDLEFALNNVEFSAAKSEIRAARLLVFQAIGVIAAEKQTEA
jgi:hypothetical protein